MKYGRISSPNYNLYVSLEISLQAVHHSISNALSHHQTLRNFESPRVYHCWIAEILHLSARFGFIYHLSSNEIVSMSNSNIYIHGHAQGYNFKKNFENVITTC